MFLLYEVICLFKVYDINNNVIECETLFTFTDYGRNFIVYLDDKDDILASFYEIRGEKTILFPITDDRDFDIVDREILKRR